MEKFSRLRQVFVYGCAILLLSSCSTSSGTGGNSQAPTALVPISCIAVIPAEASADKDDTIVYAEAESLEKGAMYATEVLKSELKGNPKVRILSSSQVASLDPEFASGTSEIVAAIGHKLHCDGVLLTTVRHYKQRQGTEYAADSPASVDIAMVLKYTGTGKILWSAEYQETQESFLSNIFLFAKAWRRGFKWVTAEQLTEQGIKERLADCPYLK